MVRPSIIAGKFLVQPRVNRMLRPQQSRGKTPKGVGGLLTSLLGGKKKGREPAPSRGRMVRRPMPYAPATRVRRPAPRAILPDGRPVRVRPDTVVYDPATGRTGRIADLEASRRMARGRNAAPRYVPPAAARTMARSYFAKRSRANEKRSGGLREKGKRAWGALWGDLAKSGNPL